MAASDGSARGRAVGFTMAMLQRRMASSIYAVRRSLERMRARRQRIHDDPEAYRQEQIERKVPDDFDDLTEEERQRIIEQLEGEVLSIDPAVLREEIGRLTRLIDQAKELEVRDVQTKLIKLKAILKEEGIFDNPKMKLLIFTEHKDTLDFLASDGRDERPLGKLREWGLTLTQIHGGMKIGDRDTPGSRICAEKEFRESCPGARRHRGRWRRHQFAILLADGELRHSLEPRSLGTAGRPHSSLRSGKELPHFQFRRAEYA